MNRTKTPLTVDPTVLADLLDGQWAAERRRGTEEDALNDELAMRS